MRKKLLKAYHTFFQFEKNDLLLITGKWLILPFLILLSAGCKKVVEENGTKGLCPEVVSTTPLNNATGVSLNSPITASFNEALDPASINATTFKVMQGTTPIAGILSYTGVTATFSPTVNLAPNTVYTATLTTGIRDPAKNAMIANYTWSFTTGIGPDIIPPTITSTDPENAAIAVSVNKKIAVAFSETMDSLSVTRSITIANTTGGGANIPGTVSYAGLTAVFFPTDDLLPNTTYAVTISTTAKDLAGNSLVANYVFNFTTGAIPDIIPPTVTSTFPANLATGVPLNSKLSATFSEAIDPATISGTSFRLNQGTTPVAGTVTYTGLTAGFAPTANLAANTLYTATVTKAAKDLAGNAMLVDYVWTFTTGAAPDLIRPTVVSTDPANTETGVALDKRVTATFSEVMDPVSVNTQTFTLRTGNTAVLGTIIYNGLTATLTPLANLAPSTVYTATITTGAKDLAGNTILSNYNWTFTTRAASDVTRPTVILTDPANASTGVLQNKKISAAFSEAMDSLSVVQNFTLVNTSLGGINVAGTVSYTGITTMFFPASDLAPNTTYTAKITKVAKDLAGNTLLNDYVWAFTTGPTPDIISPTVFSTDPLNNAVDVALNKKVAVTFSEGMDPTSLNTQTFTLRNGNTAVVGTVTYSGLTATFSPAANLNPATTYTGTITTGAKDPSGNTLASNYIWTFTTSAAADIIRPTVISTDPANNAVGVVLNKVVSATFSEAMDPLSITNISFTVRNGLVNVPGSVSYNGLTASFTPASNLLATTNYVATITTTARDLAGNTLASSYVWNFTTLTPPPSLGSAAAFGAFGGSAGVTNQGLNTVINNGGLGTTAASTLVTGFHDGLTAEVYTETPLNKGNVTGGIFTAPPAPGTAVSFTKATLALSDATTAYNSISPASKPGGIDPGAGELGGLTLAPGIYKSASGTFKISNGNLVLDAKGDPNAVWIFQTDAGLTVGIAGPAGARSVTMINGGLAKNVFWYVGSSAIINGAGGGIMSGNILAAQGVTFSTAGNAVQTVLNGRALSLNASVTMVNTTINVQ
ncbi:MAG TPA: hypothetical protein DHW64_12650 [Chitinophagaceae bacterium]|nr:hypothetical protein [Chitinophagaceae bacterium]